MRSSRIVNIAGVSIIGLLLVAVAYGPISSIWASDLSFPAYRTVQDGGSSVTQRNTLNFVFSTGAGSCVDSASPARTDCTITGTASGGVTTGVTLTADASIWGAGASTIKTGTKSGNTTLAVTGSGSYTSGHVTIIDANGNVVDGGAATAVANGGTGLTTAPARTSFVTAAECNNSSAVSVYDLPTSNAPTPNCYGTSYRFGALDFDDVANETSSFYFALPAGWTGAIDFSGFAFVNATSQSVKLTIATVCVPTSSDVLNPTFNAAQTVTVTVPGTANQLFTFTQTGVTITGCSAGNMMIFKVGRDTTDTSTATYSFTGAQLTLRITPQA